jgi:hypothetical protein
VLGDEVLNLDRQVHARAHTYLYAVSGAASVAQPATCALQTWTVHCSKSGNRQVLLTVDKQSI